MSIPNSSETKPDLLPKLFDKLETYLYTQYKTYDGGKHEDKVKVNIVILNDYLNISLVDKTKPDMYLSKIENSCGYSYTWANSFIYKVDISSLFVYKETEEQLNIEFDKITNNEMFKKHVSKFNKTLVAEFKEI